PPLAALAPTWADRTRPFGAEVRHPRPLLGRYHTGMSTPADFLAVAVEAARKGAAELERWRKQVKVKEKARADLMTDADHASQKIVRDHLLSKLPGHAFLGEEDCVGKKIEDTRPLAGGPPLWIVDPLDGTLNYVHDVPAYCVSIGLWVNGEA